MLRAKTVLILGLLATALTGCPSGGLYCQSGSKHGTQCYDRNDLEPPGGPRPDDAHKR
jgi:hypothetical protein